MKYYGFIGILVLLVVIPLQLSGSQRDSLWSEAERAYSAKRYDIAVANFLVLSDEYPHSVPTMYNLANSYLQQGDLGNAILWYERAKKYKPGDENIRHNLAIAIARRENAMIEIRQFFLVRWAHGMSQFLSPAGWGLMSLICFAGAIGLTAIGIFRGLTRNRIVGSVICALFFLLTVAMGLVRYHDIKRHDIAIVTGGPVEVKIAPDEESKLVTLITPGEKVYILDSLQQYWKIRLVNFEHGWVPVSSVERL